MTALLLVSARFANKKVIKELPLAYNDFAYKLTDLGHW